MKLLIATPLYPPEPGGPATYTKILEEGLPELGMDVVIVPFKDVRHRSKLVRHFSYMRGVMRAGRDADVILALDPVSTGFPAVIAAMLLRKPFVLKVVGDYAWEQGTQRFGVTSSLDDFVRGGRAPMPVAVLRSVETWVAHRAKLVIVPSEYLKRVVEHWHIKPGKIVVIPSVVEEVSGGSVHEEVASLPHPRVVTVARLVPWKGIDALIDAVVAVRAAGVPLSLVVVGSGPQEVQLRQRAHERLGDGYVFTGAVTPADVRATIGECDIFALNSTYEGLSHVLIEALACGLPIVATRAGGNPEVVNETCGRLVKVGDTRGLATELRELAESARLRDALGNGGRERARAFSVSSVLARTKEVLSNL
jgi:glycosyltransferase involved in cell wall biosynthesis